MDEFTRANDQALLVQIAQRDQTALSRLYDRYAPIVYSLAFQSLRSVEESEEVVLDVFAQVWRIADRYDPTRSRVDTWLFILARSRILDRLRKVRRTSPLSTLSIDDLQTPPKAENVDAFEEALIRERRSRVVAALKKLPQEQRTVLELAYYQGLTQNQIAAATGLALGTVKTRIRLGLNKLRYLFGANEEI
jgi:RNA polymerase sigma-70 factor (ECF subfamily)